VSAQVAGRRTAQLVIGAVICMACLTVVAALAADADGARHPATIASILVALIIVLGGPQLLASRGTAPRAGPPDDHRALKAAVDGGGSRIRPHRPSGPAIVATSSPGHELAGSSVGSDLDG
jgi:hypothetical protein